MTDIINLPETLWQECVRISKDPCIIASELHEDPDNHFVLAYGPVAQRNQFQKLLYCARKNFNMSIMPVNDLSLCAKIPWPGKVVCHFHWIHGKTAEAKNETQADAAVFYWEALLNRIKENGHKIVWTVHNVMPHETVWVEQDKAIHQMVANAADALHVMTNDSVKLTKQFYNLDTQKIFLVPHPTYEGAQPDDISRTEARRQLNIEDDEFVFLSFGAIMEYKGYDELMAAYDQLRCGGKRRIRLIIAGLPSNLPLCESITRWSTGKSDVIIDLSPIPNHRLQNYFRSADAAVCPYRQTLNSGAAMMALTFDLPVIGPANGAFRDLIDIGCVYGFDSSAIHHLELAMDKLTQVRVHDYREKISIAKEKLSPLKISNDFFQKIAFVAAN